MTTKVQFQDKYVTTNGLRLHYLEWGSGNKPTMVLLHGFRGHGHSWDSVSEPMSAEYRVLALDQRGRAFSDWAKDGNYTTAALVADLLGLCDGLKLESFVLVGHSMGGRNSMAFAGRHPRLVKKLVVVDISPATYHPDMGRVAGEIQNVPEEFNTFEDVFRHLRKENPLPPEDVLRRRIKYQTKELPNGKIGWRYDIAIRESMRKGARPPQDDLWEDWRRVACPILIVRGKQMDTITLEMAEKMLAANSHAQLVEVPRAHHMVFEENPDGFLTAVRDWLRKS